MRGEEVCGNGMWGGRGQGRCRARRWKCVQSKEAEERQSMWFSNFHLLAFLTFKFLLDSYLFIFNFVSAI